MEKVLFIDSGESLENYLFRVNKGTNLILRPGPKYLPLNTTIKTNYPTKAGSKFNRTQYNELPISSDHQDLISSSFNWSTKILLSQAGPFHFICSLPAGDVIWQAYVIVDPDIKIPLNSIKCQTILAKNLGPLKEWRKRLVQTKEAKYNMIHFTPVQELGSSNSAYALRNQLKVNPNFKASLDDIKKEVEFMSKKWNILSVTDIVLNHTSNDSAWIRDHPECAYNLVNSPHLRPGFLVDLAIIWLAKDMSAGNLKKTDGLTEMISSESDVKTISILLRTFYLAQLKIYELFMINISEALKNFATLKRGELIIIDSYERNNSKVTSIPSFIETPEELRTFLEKHNLSKKKQIENYLDIAVNNISSAILYERLNSAGPYYEQPVSYPSSPLVAPYFTHMPIEKFDLREEEKKIYKNGEQFMVNNGWIMGDAEDFVSPSSNCIIKRELIAWGDCIKLRYGSGPNDAPFLWDHMRKYVEAQAKVFHGFRIDNCHSTPLHVAEYIVDVARSVKPDIYIMAELFTSSESTDNHYVNHLGITSLIREAMSAHNPHELGRLMYRFGGTPVGAFYQPGAAPLKPGMANAMFYDQTHDNESPVIKRSAFDVAATTSLINMAICATGSSRGYDELVPHHINVVNESRLYPLEVDENAGILPLRRLINGILQSKLSQGFNEIFVDQVSEDVIAITRQNPTDGRSIILVARTAFTKDTSVSVVKPITIEGRVNNVLFEAQSQGDPSEYTRNENFINGLSSFKTKIVTNNAGASEAKLAKIINLGEDRAEIHLSEFKPSSVLAVEVSLSQAQSNALKTLDGWKFDFDLNFNEANYILFRCSEEDGVEPYTLPDFCKFTYCGLFGLMYYLEKVRENQDQAHPLTMNLRQGNWLSNYIVARLRGHESTLILADHLEMALKNVYLLPRGMVPKYFDLIITRLYTGLIKIIFQRMSAFINKGPELVKLLALSSVALIGECKSSLMPPIETNSPPSMAAGLPHFATGFMRNWGRDTFIAMRGLLLLTGRFQEARGIILSYARTLKHGLIPNLLDSGEKSRYNCRDAIWWWLYSIREYTKLAPNGTEILRCKIKRIHKPETSCPQRRKSVAQMANGDNDVGGLQQLSDIIQESLECHIKGMKFIEENAGKQLDEHMTMEGFKVSFGVNRETGFVFGGNEWNCGTWMDKMGSSEKADTKGKPASPRDGSAIEIIGLCKAVVNWLDDMFRNGRQYPYDGVECLYDNTITLKWTWKKWATLIQQNFEKYFYIPLDDSKKEESTMEDPHPEMINKRGIYKDTVGATRAWQDYQLRPNFLIAMVVAPELFVRDHAIYAIKLAKEQLCGPLGMKTLDPSDWNYCGDYDNGNDTIDPKVAHGFNYHQGPEWLWLTGYFIRASSKFIGESERAHHLQLLSRFHATLVSSPWLGLPELTNSDGKLCPDSCPIQAWSIGTALEALHESVRSV